MEAIDQTFLTRLLVGILIYWILGIFSKGIFEPLQAHLGRKLLSLFNNHFKELQSKADQTCSKLDDLLTKSLSDSLEQIRQIIDGDNLPETDRQLYRQLVAERYQLTVLLEKLNLKEN